MKRHISVLCLVIFVCLSACNALTTVADLERGFAAPPDSAKPWVYWWWLDGNASREGITRDLEEMRRQGIAGALLFDAGEGHTSPVGPQFMSAEWLSLFKHAVVEAHRLGLELSFNLCSGWDAGGTWVTPEHAMKKLAWSRIQITGAAQFSQELPKPPATDGYYRDVAALAFREAASTTNDLDGRSMVNLTDRMDASGRLSWSVPVGDWSVFRFGETLKGGGEGRTKCTSRGAQGYEIDFYSRPAIDRHFAATAGKIVADIGPLAGKTLKYLHDDSWECGEPNWTPRLREEFAKRRGYDLLPWLPVLAGQIVDSQVISARFLRDFRRTTADLMAENHYGRFAELSRRSGMGIHPESGGPFFVSTMDPLMNLGRSEIPMGEYWIRKSEPAGKVWYADQYPVCDSVKQAASAAHVYGKRLCQAEAFTNMGRNWEEAPFMLKDLADRAFCAGLTRNLLCFYVHQPYLDIKPGYQWPEAGTHFDRNITWWDQMHAFTAYLSRCQYLLQQGLFVADVCYFTGEEAGGFVPARLNMNPPLPAGFDCDALNSEVLMMRLSVRNGLLVLPGGMTYRILVLPPRDTMTPEVLTRIGALVKAGATVVGAKPTHSPFLKGYPECDQKVKMLADKIWNLCDGQSITVSSYGKGRICWGQTLQQVLQVDGIQPDFALANSPPDASLDYIHRRAGDTDIYFVSNQGNRAEEPQCLFRVRGRQPEIWDPLTGRIRDAVAFGQTIDGRILLPLQFAPRGSLFVVFRKPLLPGQRGTASGNFPNLSPFQEIKGPWKVAFDPKWGGPASVDFPELVDWTRRPEDGIRYYSGKAVYQKTFELPATALKPGTRLWLDLGELNHLGEVRLNGRDLGVLWTRPFRVDVTEAVRAGANQLEIAIINLWPNRLIGDSKLPRAKRYTKTNVEKFNQGEHPLLESGLLGPVTLRL